MLFISNNVGIAAKKRNNLAKKSRIYSSGSPEKVKDIRLKLKELNL